MFFFKHPFSIKHPFFLLFTLCLQLEHVTGIHVKITLLALFFILFYDLEGHRNFKRSTTISKFSIFCFIVSKDHTTLSFGHIARFFVCYESNYKSGTTLVFSHSVAKCKQHYAADCSVVFGLVLFHTNQRSWWGLYQVGMPPWAGWLWAVWAVLGSFPVLYTVGLQSPSIFYAQDKNLSGSL